MKRLIAILAMLLLGPAMAQELVPPTPVPMETGNIIYTTLNPPPEGTQFNWNGFVPYNTGGGGLEGGNIPAYNTQTGTFIWGFMQGTVTYNFYGNSFWPNDDSMVNGFKYSWEYFNQDFSRGFLSGNITFFGNGNNVLESYNFAFPQTTEGWTLLGGQIDFETPYNRSQVGRLQLSFTGVDDRFWLGYYGPQIRDLDVSILYSEAVPPPIAVDCTLYPTDPTCIIQDLTTFSTEEILALTDTTTDTGDNGSNDGSEPIVEEEEEETLIADETTEETDLEETLQDEETSSDEEVVVTEANEREVTYRELTDEEKAAILADAISKNTLELALSIAENAATNTATTTTETVATTTSRTTTVIEDTVDKIEDNKNDNDDQVADSSTDTANDLLENGRQLNNVSMAATQSQTEQSASDSINQAESIAMSSSEIKGSESIIESITIDSVIDNSSNASNNGSEVELLAEQNKVETVVEEVVANNIDQSVETSNETFDSFADIMNIVISPTVDTKDEDLEFVQSILAQSEQKVDETANTFEDDEKVTIQNDPNLSNAFNVIPNTANLEILGVLSNKQDDKSDAEKRAEQVVAANAKEQEEINKNYMDADQSGIVAAMGADTDVGSYRSAMLNDNNVWYKPEDIYKNVVYKDNVRGAYFLEKGNSDTYKKMVEEQYK